MNNPNIKLVLCSFPDIGLARQIGTDIVRKQLAACVNLIPKIESIYEWDGKIHSESEILSIFKTKSELIEKLEAEISISHPYEIPEFITLGLEGGSSRYLEWIEKTTIFV